jgi:hypothetical protein
MEYSVNFFVVITYLFLILWVYIGSVVISCLINVIAGTKIPDTFVELLKFTFLPYVAWCLIFNPDKLK